MGWVGGGRGVWERWIIKPNARTAVNMASQQSGEEDVHLEAARTESVSTTV